VTVQTDPKKKLIAHMQDTHALEQNVLRLLDSVLSTSQDEELQNLAKTHKAETEQHEVLLRERLEALGSSPSRMRQIPAILSAKVKGAGDRARTDKAVKNARDWFAVENLEIASYELLERLARRSGEEETASAALQILADEQRTAGKLAGNWSRVVDASFESQEAPSTKKKLRDAIPKPDKLKAQMSRALAAAKERPASLALGSIAAGALVSSRVPTRQGTDQPAGPDDVATSPLRASTQLREPAAMPEPIAGPPTTGVVPATAGVTRTAAEPVTQLTSVDLAQMTKPELVELARSRGLAVHSRMAKAELIATLERG
jgi:ferritin-like metal-binding protein YciE